ncbi:MAG: bifunctional adenosylcobinamide kinase/adenosylcobinamide-phosphate guanylyltransferase, partial [Candidatus Omnitrophota bacterium]
MGKITFILGGARSGKSNYALGLAKKFRGKVIFIATCQPKDVEMKKRIKAHKRTRPLSWQTVEEYINIDQAIEKTSGKYVCLVIDCLTLWVSNLILGGYNQDEITDKINKVLLSLKKIKAKAIIVSNEVGLGVVPQNKLGRDFRDVAGRINQIVASQADEVVFMVSGLPLKLRDGSQNKAKLSP